MAFRVPNVLLEKRGMIKSFLSFYTSKTVPTIRIITKGDLVTLELGKRARLRDNSLVDSLDKKGWDIKGSPIPMISGKDLELGYILHPAGCTLDLKTDVKVLRADENGKPVDPPQYLTLSFEGVIGTESDLDDFNESTEREQSRGWLLPLVIGLAAGVVFLAPLFAWLMALAGSAGH
jgi:hypothetical protein